MSLFLRRREFIAGLGGAAAWPLAATAQQPPTPVVGFLISGTPETTGHIVSGFRQGMNEAGFQEGRNVLVEYRWSYDDPTRLAEEAVDLVRRRVAVMAASTARTAVTAKAATTNIPIVFWAAADAVRSGLVNSLARPEGNLTGVNSMSAELGAKRLGLLHEMVPRAQRFGALVQPSVPDSDSRIAGAQMAAATLGVSLEVLAYQGRPPGSAGVAVEV
jgi:putative ABC transport system substrate-binding protein